MKIEDLVEGGVYTIKNFHIPLAYRVTKVSIKGRRKRFYAEPVDPKTHVKAGPVWERDLYELSDLWGYGWEPVDDFDNWVRSVRKEYEQQTSVR